MALSCNGRLHVFRMKDNATEPSTAQWLPVGGPLEAEETLGMLGQVVWGQDVALGGYNNYFLVSNSPFYPNAPGATCRGHFYVALDRNRHFFHSTNFCQYNPTRATGDGQRVGRITATTQF